MASGLPPPQPPSAPLPPPAPRPAVDLGTDAGLAAAVAAGHPRGIARLVTLAEGDDPRAEAALRRLRPRLGRAHVVGVTGAPGTGKSTLTDCLIAQARKEGLQVGVVCVDPSSPFTGGAILGDRIRMGRHANDPGVFIRSMGSRGALGGLSHHTLEAVRILDAAGKDLILVETVGVGQAEVDIARLADTVLVVLVPNLGDDVQAVKAGLMEIADLFVVNKADLVGADKVASEVEASLLLAHPAMPEGAPEGTQAWSPPIVRTSAEQGTGVPELWAAVHQHRTWSQASGTWARRRAKRARAQLETILSRSVVAFAFPRGKARQELEPMLRDLEAGKITPHEAAEGVLRLFQRE